MSPNNAMIESDTDMLDRDPTELEVFRNQQRKLISPIQLSEIKVDTKLKFMFYTIMFYVLYYLWQDFLSLEGEEEVADKKV